MVVAVWSVKGGVGVSSVTAMLGIARAQAAYDTVVVDLCGDLPALLGVDPPDSPSYGLTDWCTHGEPTADGLRRLALPASQDLRFVARGTGALPDGGVGGSGLDRSLADWPADVLVDCGVISDADTFERRQVESATSSLLVARECFLNLRRTQRFDLVPTGVVVIKEPGRSLGRADVEAVAGAPVVAELAFDAAISRCLDAGLVRARLPRSLVRSLAKVIDHVC